MQKRRKPMNYFRPLFWLLLIGAVIYLNQIADTVTPLLSATPTPTRDPESLITEATQLADQGKFGQAIDAYQLAIQARPTDPALYIALARLQIFMGKYPQAQVNAENALLLNPNNSMAHTLRAWALELQGDYLPAEAAIRDALALDDRNAVAHAVYAELLADQYLSGTGPLDAIERAAEESRTALALAPGSLEAHRARGYVLYITSNYEQAIQEYQAAIAINNNIADLHLNLGLNYRAMGIYDQAVDSFTRANAINPGDPLPDLYISRTYATVGEYTKAEQYAEQAVKDIPGDPNLHGNLGVMYYQNFKWPEALTELAYVVHGGQTEDGIQVPAMDLVPGRVTEYYFTYGLVLARSNRCGEALPIAQDLLFRVPGDEIAVYNAQEITRLCTESIGTDGATPAKTPAEITPTP